VQGDGTRYEKIKLSPTMEDGNLLAGNVQLSSGNIIFAIKIRKLMLPCWSCCVREPEERRREARLLCRFIRLETIAVSSRVLIETSVHDERNEIDDEDDDIAR
jgi:hypothetical protein